MVERRKGGEGNRWIAGSFPRKVKRHSMPLPRAYPRTGVGSPRWLAAACVYVVLAFISSTPPEHHGAAGYAQGHAHPPRAALACRLLARLRGGCIKQSFAEERPVPTHRLKRSVVPGGGVQCEEAEEAEEASGKTREVGCEIMSAAEMETHPESVRAVQDRGHSKGRGQRGELGATRIFNGSSASARVPVPRSGERTSAPRGAAAGRRARVGHGARWRAGKVQKCLVPSCNTTPNYGRRGSARPIFCRAHKQEEDVDLRHRKVECQYLGCSRQVASTPPRHPSPLLLAPAPSRSSLPRCSPLPSLCRPGPADAVGSQGVRLIPSSIGRMLRPSTSSFRRAQGPRAGPQVTLLPPSSTFQPPCSTFIHLPATFLPPSSHLPSPCCHLPPPSSTFLHLPPPSFRRLALHARALRWTAHAARACVHLPRLPLLCLDRFRKF